MDGFMEFVWSVWSWIGKVVALAALIFFSLWVVRCVSTSHVVGGTEYSRYVRSVAKSLGAPDPEHTHEDEVRNAHPQGEPPI